MAIKTMKIEADILNPELCEHCGMMELTNYPVEIHADGEVVGIINNYKCSHVRQCEYLHNYFAKETTPNMEGMKSI